VGILDDIFNTVNSPAPDLGRAIGGLFGDWIDRQTTSAEERIHTPRQQVGDIAKVIGNVAIGSTPIGQAVNVFRGVQGMANGPVVPFQPTVLQGGACPVAVPGGTQMTIGDWTDLGCPKGYELVGCIAGAGPVRGFQVVVRKKRPRRRRTAIPQSIVNQWIVLKDTLGPAMTKTIIGRQRL